MSIKSLITTTAVLSLCGCSVSVTPTVSTGRVVRIEGTVISVMYSQYQSFPDVKVMDAKCRKLLSEKSGTKWIDWDKVVIKHSRNTLTGVSTCEAAAFI